VTARGLNLSVAQNDSVQAILSATSSAQLPLTYQIITAPKQGSAKVLNATTGLAQYIPNALSTGVDSFTYGATDGSGAGLAVVSISIMAVATGTSTLTETYSNLSGNGFDLPGWTTYRSSFATDNSVAAFVTDTFAGVSKSGRSLTVFEDPSLATALPSPLYSPYSTPIDGAGQFPWLMDLRHEKTCISNATMTIDFKPIDDGTHHADITGALLNFQVQGSGAAQTLTGYVILVNGGGWSTTLSRYVGAFEHAFDYIDLWPGYPGGPNGPGNCPVAGHCANPIIDGPYKGWDYWSTPSTPAGGSAGAGHESTLASQYIYDPITGNVTINWELRQADGTDNTPGVWDNTVTLTGADAIPPGGSYGDFVSYYGVVAPAQPFMTLETTNFSLSCTN
jgi:hypothetical protein